MPEEEDVSDTEELRVHEKQLQEDTGSVCRVVATDTETEEEDKRARGADR